MAGEQQWLWERPWRCRQGWAACLGSKGSPAAQAVLARLREALRGRGSSVPPGPREAVPGHWVRAGAAQIQADTGTVERGQRRPQLVGSRSAGGMGAEAKGTGSARPGEEGALGLSSSACQHGPGLHPSFSRDGPGTDEHWRKTELLLASESVHG